MGTELDRVYMDIIGMQKLQAQKRSTSMIKQNSKINKINTAFYLLVMTTNFIKHIVSECFEYNSFQQYLYKQQGLNKRV